MVCGRCRHCLAGRRHLCANTIGLGVGRDGAFAEYVAAADDQRVAPLAGRRRGGRRDLRPVRQRGPHRACLPGPRRRRPRQRRRPDRAHGHGRRPPRRRPARRRQRAQRLSPRAGPQDGRHARHRSDRAGTPRRVRRARHGRRLRRGHGDVGQPGRAAGRHRGDGPRRRDRPARHPDRGDQPGRQRDRVQDADRPRASTVARCTRPGTR